MISREDFFMIHQLRQQGCYLADIASKVNCSVRTVQRQLKKNPPPSIRKRTIHKPGKLDPFKATIDSMLASNIWNAVVILDRIVAMGYTGKISILRDYIKPKRALRQSRATVRYETEPGRQLQHDWGELTVEIAGEQRKVYISVNTLGYSRRCFVWAAFSNDAAHTYESLVQSFNWFGGVPAEVLVDNQKAAVLKHPGNGRVTFNDGFLMLAHHYQFKPRACKPYRPQTKGKTERMVHYVKDNFFPRHAGFESLAHLNGLLVQWVRDVADERIHGTVKERVLNRFAREQSCLKPLPAMDFDTSYREQRRVPSDAYINVRTNRYSVPDRLTGQAVNIRIGLDNTLRVYDDQDQLAASHVLNDGSHQWILEPTHHRAMYESVKVETRDLSCYAEVA